MHRDAEARYQSLFSSIDQGFCVVEVLFDGDKAVDYRFLEINPSFETQTGLRDAVGRRMRELAPNHEQHWFEIYGRVASTGEPVRFQNEAVALGRWYDVYAFRVGEPELKQVGILFDDITERKRSADAIVALNKELESFSYSVSHDLRAPLRHVMGFAGLLEREASGGLSENGQRYLQRIKAASADMAQLIDDLLAFSRMTRTEMRESRVDLNALVAEAISVAQAAAPEPAIVWQTAPLPAVAGDSALLKQVVLNLVGNAVKYSRRRNPARIEIGHSGDEGDRAVLFVRDNGAGFDMQYAHKLFGVFSRLHRADEFEGTGIGLATVQRIVARHGGRVWADGAVDHGATFYFTLKRFQS